MKTVCKIPSLKNLGSYLKSIRKDSTSITSLDYNGKTLVDSTAKAEALNSHFKSVFTSEDQTILPDKGDSPHPSIADLDISPYGIYNLLSGLNIHKSAGPDKINATILKETREVTAPILCLIFCCSLRTGVVPKDWKQANVVPIYKRGKSPRPLKLQANISY